LNEAIKLALSEEKKGVYLAFKGEDGKGLSYIKGFSVKPVIFDQAYFNSGHNSRRKMGRGPLLSYPENLNDKKVKKAQSNIVSISLYPGIDRELLEAAANNRKIVVINLYHSDTGPSSFDYPGLIDFIESASKKGITVLMATLPAAQVTTPHASMKKIQQAGAYIYSDIQTHYIYTFSLLALSLGFSNNQIVKRLSEWQVDI